MGIYPILQISQVTLLAVVVFLYLQPQLLPGGPTSMVTMLNCSKIIHSFPLLFEAVLVSLDLLNSKHAFLMVLESRKSKIKLPADLVSGDAGFLVCRWLSSCIRIQGRVKQDKASCLKSFYQGIKPRS